MFSFKRSLIALVGLLVIVGAPLVSRGQGDIKNPLKRDSRRSFYLTQTSHTGGQAPSACAEGYHMASIWEIYDPTYLRYDTELGLTEADSGFGPPTLRFGWVRTGSNAFEDNCQAYTSANSEFTGVTVALTAKNSWTSPARELSPWVAFDNACHGTPRVWCVQD